MKTASIRLQSLDSIPVFPLNHVHLFPGCLLSLRIFEPRYIDLLHYAIENDHILAIADPQSVLDLHQPEMYCNTTPYIPPLVGAGLIVDVKKTRYNTYDIVIHGLQRLEVLEECPMDKAFRQFATRFREDDPIDEELLTFSNLQLRDLVVQLGQRVPKFRKVTTALLEHYISPDIFTYFLVSKLTESKKLKKSIFLETNPLQRNQMIEEEIGRLIVSLIDQSQKVIVH